MRAATTIRRLGSPGGNGQCLVSIDPKLLAGERAAINLKPACDEIAIQPLTVKDSFVELPTTPGHGIDLDVANESAQSPIATWGRGPESHCASYTEEFPRKHYLQR